MKRAAVLLGGVVAFGAAPGDAQSVRFSGVTTLQYLDVRPMVEDSIPILLEEKAIGTTQLGDF